MKNLRLPATLSLILALAITFQLQAHDEGPNPKELIAKVTEAMGGWNNLYKLKDVQFDYIYEYPGMDKFDISQERYIFEGEHSWGQYSKHQINVMPEAEGVVTQSMVNNQAYINHNGKTISDEAAIGGTMFLRKANYYWFTMMYKLDNPGTILAYEGNEFIGDINYEKVMLTFDGDKTGKAANDAYILYINPNTNLVDQFYFSLPAMGVNSPVILMKLEYETIKEIMVPSKRMIFQPNEKGEYPTNPNLVQTSKNIKFKNKFKPADFMLK